MQVILFEDVKSLGKKGDIVKVSDGYARNFILKKKLGAEATAKNLNDLKLKRQNEDKVAAENLANAQKLASEISGKSVALSIKAGSDGRAFGSVSTKDISVAAKEQLGFDLDKKKMHLDEPIKSVGIFTVTIKLHPSVSAELKVVVEQE